MTSAFVEPASGSTDLRYDGAYVPGSYSDGDIVVYNGIAYMAHRPTTNPPVPWPVGGLAPVTVGGMVPIFDTILSAPQQSIDIPSIPQTYAHLRLVGSLRSTFAGANDQAVLRFNSDTGANYSYQFMRGAGSSATATENLSAAGFCYFGQPVGANGPANAFDISVIDIIDYASAVKHKSAIGQFGLRGDSTGGMQFGNVVNFWKSLAPINEILMYASNGTWVAGSRLTLYGMLATPTIQPAISPIVAPVPATTLPTSPGDQQQAILVDNTTTPTYSWLFQWSAAASKWFCIGGSPLQLEITTNEARSGTGTFGDLTTVGPTFTLPRAGAYIIGGQCDTNFNSTGVRNVLGFSLGTTPTAADTIIAYLGVNSGGSTTTGMQTVVAAPRLRTGLTAGMVVKMQYNDGGGSANFRNRIMSVQPLWVT